MFLMSYGLQAQQTIAASGGAITSSTGNVSYTIGQPFQNVLSSTEFFVFEGAQQAYEISQTLSTPESSAGIQFKVFPNPATDYLMLTFPDSIQDMEYQLSTLDGKLVDRKSLQQLDSRINLTHLPVAVYILNILKNNQPVQTIKILKK